jgi:hypothetical protein
MLVTGWHACCGRCVVRTGVGHTKTGLVRCTTSSSRLPGEQTQPKIMTYYHLTCRREALRAAVAINNIGCTLLERGCFAQAHQTLQDAARATVVLLGDEDTTESRASVALKLAAADQRLALPCCAPSSPFASLRGKDKAPAPLRIPFDDANDDPDFPDLVVMSAIAVHNSALSCYYLSTTTPAVEADFSPDKRRRLLIKAKVLLKSSYCLIVDRPSSGSHATLSCALHILENLHLVVVRPLSSLAASSSTTSTWSSTRRADDHDDDHLSGLEAELAHLRFTVQAVERADRHYFGRPDPVAAAA